MAVGFYVVQSAGKIYSVTPAGVATEITLPTGVTVDSTRVLRGAMLNRQLVLCGSPSETLWLDAYGVCRRLLMKPPSGPPILAAGTGIGLNGSYRGKFTNIIRDPVTKGVVAESDFSPISAATAVLVNQSIAWSQIAAAPPISATPTARRLYRTTTGPGSTYFRCIDVDGNERVLVDNNMSDTRLGLLAAPTDLGSPTGAFEQIVEWKDRLWAKAYNAIDNLAYSANRKHYAWPATNFIPVRPLGEDTVGISALLPRRDELGVGRKDRLWKVIGDPPNIQFIKVYEGVGPVSPDAVRIIRDRAFFLAADGVYVWDQNGVTSIVDDDVKPWFTTDDTFNRSRFSVAFARYNREQNTYELHLAAAGSSNEDRWIAYDLDRKKWLGPHRTSAFTPSASGELKDSNGVEFPFIGDTAGFLWAMNQVSRSDGGTAVAFDVKLRHNHLADLMKIWLEMSVFTKKEAAGALTITPAVGNLDATDQAAPISHDLTLERERLRRLSTSAQPSGRICTLTFTNSQNAQDVGLLGYEVPVAPAGRR